MDHCVLRSFRVLLCFLGVVQMAVYKMIVTYLVLLRSLRLAALHALRAAGVEFTSARRIQCRGDIALQNDPVFLCLRGYGLGIQWHPEAMLMASDDMLPVFTGLIEAAKKAADK